MPPKKKSTSFGELLGNLSAGLSTVAMKPNVHNYVPHEKQKLFHNSPSGGRLYIGGNRSGKTVGGIVEDIYYATGKHPYKEVKPTPTHGRIVTVDFKNGANKIILPVLSQWIPPSELINGSWEDSFNKSEYVLTLANDSKIEIMSHEQPLEKFAGTSRDYTHFDEECPADIFKECKARLVDVNGDWWMTMTPIDGMTWVYDDIFMPGTENPEASGIDVIVVDIADNPYVPAESRIDFLAGLNEEDMNIRGSGKFVALGGLILREFRYDRHVTDYRDPPLHWEWWTSLDSGIANPTAVLWHAINPSGNVYTFMEHYKAEWTVKQHTDRIKEINLELGRDPDRYIGDPAMRQRNVVTGHSIQIEYALNGINIGMANNQVDAGLDKMNEYLRQGRWVISKKCPNLIKEIRKYKRKDYSSSKLKDKNNKREEPMKKDDHAIDSCRYLFSFMPDLTPMQNTIELADIRRANEAVFAELRPGTRTAREIFYPVVRDLNLNASARAVDGWGEE